MDKKLSPHWVEKLFARGEPTVYRGEDLENIAMPIGGICAGQVYLLGDGRLGYWDIFNQYRFSGYGATNYQARPGKVADVAQGFGIFWESGGRWSFRPVSRAGFKEVTFRGEYPLGLCRLRGSGSADSNSPGGLFAVYPTQRRGLGPASHHFGIRASQSLAGTSAGDLCRMAGKCHSASLVASISPQSDRTTWWPSPILLPWWASVEASPTAGATAHCACRFRGEDYGGWTAEGEAFGTGPAKGTFPRQQTVSGFFGKRLGEYLPGRFGSPDRQAGFAAL